MYIDPTTEGAIKLRNIGLMGYQANGLMDYHTDNQTNGLLDYLANGITTHRDNGLTYHIVHQNIQPQRQHTTRHCYETIISGEAGALNKAGISTLS